MRLLFIYEHGGFPLVGADGKTFSFVFAKEDGQLPIHC
jgi:hypothetical protein